MGGLILDGSSQGAESDDALKAEYSEKQGQEEQDVEGMILRHRECAASLRKPNNSINHRTAS